MDIIILLGQVLGIGFVSGINLYATVFALGIAIRYGFIQLYPDMSELYILSGPYIILIAGIAYLVEFFADKIPWFDSAWDSFHTFIRPVGAAIIASKAIGHLDTSVEIALILLCGFVAFSSHTTKTGIRLIANLSPEPFTNAGLSVAEDIVAVGGTWLAMAHPVLMLSIVLIFILILMVVAQKLFRFIYAKTLALLLMFRMLFKRIVSIIY